MKTAMKGIVHGKTIELDEEPGLPDGQEVSVTVEPLSASHIADQSRRSGIASPSSRGMGR